MYWSSMFYLFGRKLYLIQIVKFMVTFQYNITTDSITMDIGIVVFGLQGSLGISVADMLSFVPLP